MIEKTCTHCSMTCVAEDVRAALIRAGAPNNILELIVASRELALAIAQTANACASSQYISPSQVRGVLPQHARRGDSPPSYSISLSGISEVFELEWIFLEEPSSDNGNHHDCMPDQVMASSENFFPYFHIIPDFFRPTFQLGYVPSWSSRPQAGASLLILKYSDALKRLGGSGFFMGILVGREGQNTEKWMTHHFWCLLPQEAVNMLGIYATAKMMMEAVASTHSFLYQKRGFSEPLRIRVDMGFALEPSSASWQAMLTGNIHQFQIVEFQKNEHPAAMLARLFMLLMREDGSAQSTTCFKRGIQIYGDEQAIHELIRTERTGFLPAIFVPCPRSNKGGH